MGCIGIHTATPGTFDKVSAGASFANRVDCSALYNDAMHEFDITRSEGAL